MVVDLVTFITAGMGHWSREETTASWEGEFGSQSSTPISS